MIVVGCRGRLRRVATEVVHHNLVDAITTATLKECLGPIVGVPRGANCCGHEVWAQGSRHGPRLDHDGLVVQPPTRQQFNCRNDRKRLRRRVRNDLRCFAYDGFGHQRVPDTVSSATPAASSRTSACATPWGLPSTSTAASSPRMVGGSWQWT